MRVSCSCLLVLAASACWPLDAPAAAYPSYICYRRPSQTELTIDGDLADWPTVPILLLGQAGQVVSGAWSGPADSHANVTMLWDSQRLYMAIAVIDDTTTLDVSREDAFRMFTQDGLQWAVDLADDGGQGYGPDNYEYGFSVLDGVPTAYRWYSGGGWPKGIAEHIELAVRPHPRGGLIYEAAVEYAMLAPLAPSDGHRIRFNIVLQDRDGDQRKTLAWTPGIATGKNPSAFGTLRFSAAAPGDHAGGVLVSAPNQVGGNGFEFHVMVQTRAADAVLTYDLRNGEGQALDQGSLTRRPGDGNTYIGRLETADLASGSYVVRILDQDGNPLTDVSFERIAIEDIHSLVGASARLAAQLRQLIEETEGTAVQPHYARSAVAAHDVFGPFIEDDVNRGRYKLALHNARALNRTLSDRLRQLRAWMERPDGTPALWRLPELDYSRTRRVGRDLMVDGHRVLLVGPMSWLWQLHGQIDHIAALGYNQVKVGFQGQHHFDDLGQLLDLADQPWWAVRDIRKAAHANRMSFGISMMCPDQVWRGASRRGALSLGDFHDIYDHFAARQLPRLGRGFVFDHTIAVEAQRAPVAYEESHHGQLWRRYLGDAYGSVEGLNAAWGTTYASLNQVPFPDSLPEAPAARYDYTRMRQIMISDELARAADIIRRHDPGVLVHGYPYVWTFREPAAYYEHALDPELDTRNTDMVGCDTSGPYHDARYAMPTVTWLAGYYDLMRGIAGDRPVCDGEFHYTNRRRIYPDNWARAIYMQGYIHALSSSYAWVWHRSESLDAALLLDARVLVQSAQAALDLRRLAEPIAAFHRQPDDVVFLYSNASTPHARREDETTLSQRVQTDLAYEGLFFQGLKLGFVTERQLQRGLVERGAPLIIANSSHVAPATYHAAETFARAGGTLVLVGDCLTHTPQGLEQPPFPELSNVVRHPGFVDADEARRALVPVLERAGIAPLFALAADASQEHPTVEWQRAVDDSGRSLLFLLNLGYTTARVDLPPRFHEAEQLVEGTVAPTTLTLTPLAFALLRERPAAAPAHQADAAPAAQTENPGRIAAHDRPAAVNRVPAEPENLITNGTFDRNPINAHGWIVVSGETTWAGHDRVHVRPGTRHDGRLQQRIRGLQRDTAYVVQAMHAGWGRAKPSWVHTYLRVRDPETDEIIAQAMRRGTESEADAEPETLRLEFTVRGRTEVLVSIESRAGGPEARIDDVSMRRTAGTR